MSDRYVILMDQHEYFTGYRCEDALRAWTTARAGAFEYDDFESAIAAAEELAHDQSPEHVLTVLRADGDEPLARFGPTSLESAS